MGKQDAIHAECQRMVCGAAAVNFASLNRHRAHSDRFSQCIEEAKIENWCAHRGVLDDMIKIEFIFFTPNNISY